MGLHRVAAWTHTRGSHGGTGAAVPALLTRNGNETKYHQLLKQTPFKNIELAFNKRLRQHSVSPFKVKNRIVIQVQPSCMIGLFLKDVDKLKIQRWNHMNFSSNAKGKLRCCSMLANEAFKYEKLMICII